MRGYLKKMREEAKLSCAEMAKKLDISESYYSLIENGKRQENMELLLAAKLAAIFSIPMSVILKEENKLKERST